MGRRHLVIPDTQIKPEVPTEHIDWIAQYAVDKKPDVLVIIGDWADMPSLSHYDKGKKSAEGRTYQEDINAANHALQQLMAPIEAEQERLLKGHRKHWNLRKVVTLGNHEHRINRAIEEDRKWEGKASTDDLFFKQWGYEVYPFLETAVVDGIAYCHFFSSGPMNKPITKAARLLSEKHMSCFAGHQQGRDIAYGKRADGARLTAIICGSCYLHDEPYLGPQGNQHFRGIYMLNEVTDGSFDEMPVSLGFLKARYEERASARGRSDGSTSRPTASPLES